MKKRLIVTVSNDIATDQRVRKQCNSLWQAGYEVHLYGRLLPDSMPVDRPYRVRRLKLLFNRNALFYAELNIRLFLILLFAKASGYYANDLDTLPASALASLIRRKPLVYDSHEFFTGVPEIQDKKWIKATWSFLELLFIKRCKIVITVNESIGELLKETYKVSEVLSVRNVPDLCVLQASPDREALGLPTEGHLLILQGAGINMHRGSEELVRAMTYLPDVVLVIVGSGDALPVLKKMVEENALCERVRFFPKMAYADMMRYTASASIGLSLDKDTNINYRYSLPNKVFDYIQAGIPVLVSDLYELRKLVENNQIGRVVQSHNPETLAQAIGEMLRDEQALKSYKANVVKLRTRLRWDLEFAPVLEALESIGLRS